jgi:hypothetical protein
VNTVDRGNLTTRIEFRVQKKQDTAKAAQNYAIRHASELCDLQIALIIVGEPTNTAYCLKNAVISSVESTDNWSVADHWIKL